MTLSLVVEPDFAVYL